MNDKPDMKYFGGGWERVQPSDDRIESKIIDIHCHIFKRFGTGSDEEYARRSLMFWQYHTRDFTTFWRKEDGKRVEEMLLDYPSDDIYAMPDVQFRMGKYGQGEVTIDGVDYYVQFYPPGLENLDAIPRRMIAEMDIAEVDIGVLQSDHVYGDVNAYYGEARRAHPGRFVGLAQVHEWEEDQTAEANRLEKAVVEHGNRGLYFSVEPLSLNHYLDHIDDSKFDPLWNKVRQLEIPIFWYLDARKQDRVAGFMERVAELDRWSSANPDIPSVITHGIVPAAIIHEIGIPDSVLDILKRPNVYAEVLMPAKWPAYEYPYVEGQEMLKALCDDIGVEKLMYGSDMPFSGAFWCTYRQSVDFIRVHCDFLSVDEKALVLGGNAARLLDLST